jgi:hypothetical protein
MPSGIASLPYHLRNQEPEGHIRLPYRARFQTLRLDRRLASGASFEETPRIADRARQLADAAARDKLAATVERLVVLAAGSPRELLGPARVPFQAKRVLSNRDLFVRIAGILRRSESPAVEGIARMSVLLRDNRSALYANKSHEDLRGTLSGIIDALDH